jgi:uncharacterized RDD family membrane protein YckC
MQISINTTQHVTIDYQLASIGDRLIAFVIDLFIQLSFVILMAFGMQKAEIDSPALMTALVSIPYVLYDVISETLLEGQSMGKRAAGVKVVSLDGKQPSVSQYILRWILRPLDFAIGYGMVAVMTILIGGKGQRLGDLAAGTCVVRTKRQVGFSKNLFPEFDESYQATFPQVRQMTDRDVNIIKDVLRAYKRNEEVKLLRLMAAKVKENLGIEEHELSNLKFLQTIVKDYHHTHGRV